ncbi:uncharacterized protein LOC112183813 [Rosa chinensis]|uniref:uncharacterized protein LOC112183813 n=1 Tax=Rosa chinensis TaxID=74649 RepID=UPI000D0889F6|nr:uncharacterized protein LOC112183813 [Rosa chinensis]
MGDTVCRWWRQFYMGSKTINVDRVVPDHNWYGLNNRPWYMRSRLFRLQRWTHDFDATISVIDSIIVWVCLPNLPLPHWNTKSLEQIVQPLGHFILADENTLAAKKCIFARVLVELDLRYPLKRTVITHNTDGFPSTTIMVSYEVVFEVCFRKGKGKGNFYQKQGSGNLRFMPKSNNVVPGVSFKDAAVGIGVIGDKVGKEKKKEVIVICDGSSQEVD